MTQRFFWVLFCLFSLFTSAQKIEISVLDAEGKPLSDINVQLQQNNTTLEFQKSNANGKCQFSVAKDGDYQLKLTSMHYKTKTVVVPADNKTLEVILEPQLTEIETVVIKARPKIAALKGDTLKYNLNAIKDGTERTAEDLIKKLPGLDVNENGKVTHNGNVIGQVLIDGNEFFGKNHKIATQNISSNMIESIDLWKNYTTMNGNGSTALNLKLKDEYKRKFTGNIEANYGTHHFYLGHANLFKFNQLGNFAFIADANSIAKNPISIADFNEMNTTEDANKPNETPSLDIPSFLNNDVNVKEKTNQFGALQYAKSGKKFSVLAHSILNFTQIQKLANTTRTAFSGQPEGYNFAENNVQKMDGFLGATQLKIKRNFSADSFLYYAFNFNPSQDHYNQEISRSTTTENRLFQIENTEKSNALTHFLSWNKTMKNSKLILSFSQQNRNTFDDISVHSNLNLFFTSQPKIAQTNEIYTKKYTLDAYLKNTWKWAMVNFHSGYFFSSEEGFSVEKSTAKTENIALLTHHYLNEVFVQKQWKSFDLSANLGSHFMYFNQIQRHFLEKNIKLKYHLPTQVNSDIQVEYHNKYRPPSFALLYQLPLYDKTLEIHQNQNISSESLVNTHSFNLNFHRFDMAKGHLFFLAMMYSTSGENFSENTQNFGQFSQIQNVLGRFFNQFYGVIVDERKLGKYLRLKTKLSSHFINSNNFITQKSNDNGISTQEISQKMSSLFRTFPVQIEMGYTYTFSHFSQSLYDVSVEQHNTKYALGLKSNFKRNWIISLLSEYLIQKNPSSQLENLLISGQVFYKKEKSPIEYSLTFNNVLHLNQFQRLTVSANSLGTELSFQSSMRGYILGGIKFLF